MHKYIQNKLDKERFLNAKQAATVAFNHILNKDFIWPFTIDNSGQKVEPKYGNVVPNELVELLLIKKLELHNPNQPKYKEVLTEFDELFLIYKQV